MFDFLKPLAQMFQGWGGGEETSAEPSHKKTRPPDPKPKADEKAEGNGLDGAASGMFSGLFDDLASMGEDPTEEVEESASAAVDVKKLPPAEDLASTPEKLVEEPVVEDSSKMAEPMLDPAAAEKSEQEKARAAFDAGARTPEQEAVLEQANKLAGQEIVGVAEARRLAEMARAAGVPLELLPKASSPEDILRAKGMDEKEIQLYKKTLNKDQQSTLPPEAKADYEEKKERKIEDSATKDAQGKEREKASDEEIAAALKANIILFDQMQPGLPLTKVIPEAQVGGLLVGEVVDDKGKVRKMTKMAGDIGSSANTEGMTAAEKVGYLGLDYDEKTYVERGPDGQVKVKEECQQRLYQIEQAATEDQVEFAQVPMGHDMYQAALAEAQRLKAEGKPLPRLLELDEHGQLIHVVERNRHHQNDPSAGFGYTASQMLRKPEGGEGAGEQFFTPNQEMNAGVQDLQVGAELTCVDDKGERKVLARFDGKRFVPVTEDEEDLAKLQAMMAEQQAKNDDNRTHAAVA